MNNEALLWIGLILASPAIYMLTKVAVTLLLGLFIRDEKVTVRYTDENGVTKQCMVDLSDGDELLDLMDQIKRTRPKGEKRA